jgi:hypothetical protein
MQQAQQQSGTPGRCSRQRTALHTCTFTTMTMMTHTMNMNMKTTMIMTMTQQMTMTGMRVYPEPRAVGQISGDQL